MGSFVLLCWDFAPLSWLWPQCCGRSYGFWARWGWRWGVMPTGGVGYRETGLGWPDAMPPAEPAWGVTAGEGAGTGPGRVRGGGRAGWPAGPGLGFRLGRAHRMMRAVWEGAIADLGLSPPQAALLGVVADLPGGGLRELARRMDADATNAKRLADHLERAGLVVSASDPRHRQRRVLRPTGKGSVIAGELARRAAALDRRIASLLGPAGLARLQGLLDGLGSVLASGLAPASGPEPRMKGSWAEGGGR
jgi:DNA-binding MarR family transcriptional regulator